MTDKLNPNSSPVTLGQSYQPAEMEKPIIGRLGSCRGRSRQNRLEGPALTGLATTVYNSHTLVVHQRSRTHLALGKDTPEWRSVQPVSTGPAGCIIGTSGWRPDWHRYRIIGLRR